jgi:phospholipid/cholesterol/gamma-HCH transport system substrate-binding protein
MTTTRRRLLGLTFVAILAAGVALSILSYNKAFDPAVRVTLRTNEVGLQLNDGADVKLRDVVVGRVDSIRSNGRGASLVLALEPDKVSFVPPNVHARLLPRTLFGERYVALVPPANAATGAIRAGAVISQDRSRTAIELEQVLDHSLALFQKIDVDSLAAILNTLAKAVEGRGEQIGKDIVTLDGYLTALNKELPAISDDIRLLADTLAGYDGAASDLLAFLRDATVTARTVTQQREQLNQFLVATTGAAQAAESFLDRHGDNLIRVGDVTAPVAQLLAAYAPVYPCLLGGIVAMEARTTRAFEGGRVHVTQWALEGANYPDQGEYRPGDEPVFGDRRGPDCRRVDELRRLPTTAEVIPPANPPQYVDGYRDGSGASAAAAGPATSAANDVTPVALRDPSMGWAGTSEEIGLVRALVAAFTDRPADTVPDVAALLWAPLLRGTVVSVS